VSRRDRHDLGLQLIIVFKFVKAVVLVALGICALFFSKSSLYRTGEDIVTWIGFNAGRSTVRHLLDVPDSKIHLMAIGSILYAAVFAAEGWFLHKRKSWAEWMTVIVTGSFLPLEVYELVKHPTAGKVAALIGNIAIVIYLVIRRLRDR
jgi:uncharacterized membrane protein (DUF2068 family)